MAESSTEERRFREAGFEKILNLSELGEKNIKAVGVMVTFAWCEWEI